MGEGTRRGLERGGWSEGDSLSGGDSRSSRVEDGGREGGGQNETAG